MKVVEHKMKEKAVGKSCKKPLRRGQQEEERIN
jgi:hypothetical protein